MKKLVYILSLLSCLNLIGQVVPNKDFVVQATQGGLDIHGVASALDYTTGAIYVVGYKNTVSSGKDLFIVKLDSNGVQLWSNSYDYASLDDKANAVYVD